MTDAVTADVTMTDAMAADVTTTEAVTADVTTTDANVADAAMTGAVMADAAMTDAKATDAVRADITKTDAARVDVTKTDAAESRGFRRKEQRVRNAPRAFAVAGDCMTIRLPWSIHPAKAGTRSMLPTLRLRAERCFQSLTCRLNLQNAERGACNELS